LRWNNDLELVVKVVEHCSGYAQLQMRGIEQRQQATINNIPTKREYKEVLISTKQEEGKIE
jgi:hypothetical protein